MPRYCYKDNEGNVIARPYEIGKAPKSFKLGGKVFKRDFHSEHCGTTHTPGTWPMKSDAAGVHPDQIKEATDHANKHGVPTSFTPDGRAIFTGREHRRKYCQLIGLHDRNGGYSDP